MPTNYSDQFFDIDPAFPPAVGTLLTVSIYTLTDENDDGDVDRFDDDSINGSDITSSWPGDTVTINVAGVGNVTYVGITFYLADGSRVFTPTDGQVLQQGTFVSSTWVTTQGSLDPNDLGPPCFVRGTLISTPYGEVPVEDLSVGDLVETLDGGPESLIWIGRRSVDGFGKYAPVRIDEGRFGNLRPLWVSPQHRLLVKGWACEMNFGHWEYLAAAKHLLGPGVSIEAKETVEYWHFMFSGHQIVFAEGIPTESFNPHGSHRHSDRKIAAETLSLFPELRGRRTESTTVRPVLKGFEAKMVSKELAAAANI